MKRVFYFPILLFAIIINIASAEIMEVDSVPVYYPQGTIGSQSPYLVWYDKYIQRDKKVNVKYRITISSLNSDHKTMKPLVITPEIYDNNYYYYKIPFILEQDKYKYMIERLIDSKSHKSKYFSYRKYPISGEFAVDYNEKSQIDDLPLERLIRYTQLDEKNRLVNGCNSIFYGSAAIGSFGIGYIFYKTLDFGSIRKHKYLKYLVLWYYKIHEYKTICKIIYTIAFTSTAIGISASGYYGYKYIKGKNELNKILDISKDVSFNGSFSFEGTYAGWNLSY